MLDVTHVEHKEIEKIIQKMKDYAKLQQETEENLGKTIGLNTFIHKIEHTHKELVRCEKQQASEKQELKLLIDLIKNSQLASAHDMELHANILADIAKALEITDEESLEAVKKHWWWPFAKTSLIEGQKKSIECAIEGLENHVEHMSKIKSRPQYDQDFAWEGSGMEGKEKHCSLLDKPGTSETKGN